MLLEAQLPSILKQTLYGVAATSFIQVALRINDVAIKNY